MTAPALALRDPDLTGLHVLVVGAARSGLAAAALAGSRGARVVVTDRRPLDQLGDAARRLDELGARLVAGGHPPSLLEPCDLLIVSPGVPPTIELLERARGAGIPLWGEVELAARFCRGRIVGITGSNGKSTVTAMLGAILRGAGVPGGTGGNLATPLSDLLVHDAPDAVHAVELSSFQIDSLVSLRPAVALLLNLAPDHLDRYGSYEAYARAKARLFELQGPDDDAVLNADDADTGRFVASVPARRHEFSLRGEPRRGAFLRGGRLVLRTDGGEAELLAASDLPVPGEHNVANALAAALAAALSGCAAPAIAAGLRGYRALAHRLERVAEIAGVAFYNDSKATNPASAVQALRAFPGRSVQLILGGRDKGADWSELAAMLPGRVARVLLVGEAAALLRRTLEGRVALVDCVEMGRAVREARSAARPGDVVLLSPGCASFDQYANFEERGAHFRRLVLALDGPREDGDA